MESEREGAEEAGAHFREFAGHTVGLSFHATIAKSIICIMS